MWQFSKLQSAYLLRFASILFDLSIAASAFYLAYVSVLDYQQMLQVPGILEKGLAFTAISAVSFILFSVTRGSWRYVSIPDLIALIKASLFSVAIYTIGSFLVSRAD